MFGYVPTCMAWQFNGLQAYAVYTFLAAAVISTFVATTLLIPYVPSRCPLLLPVYPKCYMYNYIADRLQTILSVYANISINTAYIHCNNIILLVFPLSLLHPPSPSLSLSCFAPASILITIKEIKPFLIHL